jgi:hypothetical protein
MTVVDFSRDSVAVTAMTAFDAARSELPPHRLQTAGTSLLLTPESMCSRSRYRRWVYPEVASVLSRLLEWLPQVCSNSPPSRLEFPGARGWASTGANVVRLNFDGQC